MKKERVQKLNKRHKRFCDEYLKDFNAARAYKTVYPTAKDETAYVNGSKLLSNAKVSAYLSEHLRKTEIESIASLNDLLSTITAIALKKPRKTIFKQYDNTKKDENGKPKVLCDETTITQPSDKSQLQALELLSRYYNIFMNTENPKVTKAKLRKTNAETKLIEARTKAMEENGHDIATALDEIMDKVIDESNKKAKEEKS